MPSTAVDVRSVSPCTVVASENAMADSASESHSTASSALPDRTVERASGLPWRLSRRHFFRGEHNARKNAAMAGQRPAPRPLLVIPILKNRIPVHVNTRRNTDRPQARPAFLDRLHLDPNR